MYLKLPNQEVFLLFLYRKELPALCIWLKRQINRHYDAGILALSKTLCCAVSPLPLRKDKSLLH